MESCNNSEIKDIPYYNGYYTLKGEKLLVAYPGYPYIKVCINNGDDNCEYTSIMKKLGITCHDIGAKWTCIGFTAFVWDYIYMVADGGRQNMVFIQDI